MNLPIEPGESREHYKGRLADANCLDLIDIDCPCCQGTGAHAFGDGPNADTYECKTCGGEGYLEVMTP